MDLHRRFIARRYHRGCPAAAIDPLQSESFPIRPSGSSYAGLAWGGGGHLNPTGDKSVRNLRCQISEIRNSPGFAYKANPNSVGTPLLSDDGAVMFASLLLAGHSARWARKVSHGAIVSSHVLLYLRLLPL